jgi:hypothetical protein
MYWKAQPVWRKAEMFLKELEPHGANGSEVDNRQ